MACEPNCFAGGKGPFACANCFDIQSRRERGRQAAKDWKVPDWKVPFVRPEEYEETKKALIANLTALAGPPLTIKAPKECRVGETFGACQCSQCVEFGGHRIGTRPSGDLFSPEKWKGDYSSGQYFSEGGWYMSGAEYKAELASWTKRQSAELASIKPVDCGWESLSPRAVAFNANREAPSVRLEGLRFDITDRKVLASLRKGHLYAVVERNRYTKEPDSVHLKVELNECQIAFQDLPPKMAEWGEGDIKGWLHDRVLPPIEKMVAKFDNDLTAYLETLEK